jgi:uncharacterized protein DUF6438
MRHLFAIVGPLLLLCARALSADEIPDDSVISLQHHTCERHCAVYKVVLFGDGTVVYYGQYDVRRKGLVLGNIDREVFQKLIDSAKRIDYFNLKSEYGYHDMNGCDERLPDAPIVSTSITVGGQSHGIIHHQRCGSPITKQLTEFESEIVKLANVAPFIK